MTAPVVILADDDETIRAVLTQAFSRANYVVRATGNAATLWRWVAEGQGDLVVSDVVLPDENVFEILPRMKKARPGLPIIVMSAKNTIMTAITAAERGAYDYLPKPFDLNELLGLAAKAIEHSQRPSSSAAASASPAESLPIIGRSPAMQDIFRIIARMTQTDLTVMISGESGTGKELVAKALHDFGRRRKGPFVAVNMAAIPRELIESELFGHEKGAFTGAAQRFAGRFEQAQGGTLFLDEIGDMPMEAQTRLLRVLQQGEYMTVGGRNPLKADVRIIAATHRELRQLIAQGLFREDLYYRLNVVPVRLPPLRERPDDIEDLTSHFLASCEAEGLARKRLTRDALERLRRYRWPGNVRELENLVRRIAAIYVDETITAEIVERELENGAPPIGEAEGMESLDTLPLSEFTARFLERQFAGFAPGLPPCGLYQRTLREVEVPLITAALAATGANQLRAAELLGINRNTLRARIRELGLQVVRSSV
jgi:two-component system, NtrC family, nitrogen regulation response regulator GlnG